MRPIHLITALPLPFALLTASLHAQHASAVFHGDRPDMAMGAIFDHAGDVNGDGVPDLVVGDPLDSTSAAEAGRAFVLSGANGDVLFTFYGDQPGDRLGSTVAFGGDVNNDGTPDVIVGSPVDNFGTGSAWVLSGDDGSIIYHERGVSVGDDFALTIAGVGDTNGDEFDDFLIGAPGVDDSLPNQGRFYLYSGATGLLLRETTGYSGVQARYGSAISAVGDVNGDGNADYLAGTRHFFDIGYIFIPGHIYLIDGASGSALRSYEGIDTGHGFADFVGEMISDAGDVDLDGSADYMISEIESGNKIVIYSGATGDVIRSYPLHYANSEFARAANAGDVDGDGVPDQVLKLPNTQGRHVMSGADGSLLQTLATPIGPGVEFGADYTGIGDFDGDGLGDVAVGMPGADVTFEGAGAIAVFSGNPCGPADNYCEGLPNSAGAGSSISYAGSSSVGANNLTLIADGCPTQQFGVFFYGDTQESLPQFDGIRCVAPPLYRLPPSSTGMNGVATHVLDVTAPPQAAALISAGSTWNFQFWYRDVAAGGAGSNLSDGLSVEFCQ